MFACKAAYDGTTEIFEYMLTGLPVVPSGHVDAAKKWADKGHSRHSDMSGSQVQPIGGDS